MWGCCSPSSPARFRRGHAAWPVRADLAVRLAKVKYQGIARTYAFGDFHQYDNSSTGWADATFVHEVRGGRFRQLGSLGDLHRAAESQS